MRRVRVSYLVRPMRATLRDLPFLVQGVRSLGDLRLVGRVFYCYVRSKGRQSVRRFGMGGLCSLLLFFSRTSIFRVARIRGTILGLRRVSFRAVRGVP